VPWDKGRSETPALAAPEQVFRTHLMVMHWRYNIRATGFIKVKKAPFFGRGVQMEIGTRMEIRDEYTTI
jgi:hypothetical protein